MFNPPHPETYRDQLRAFLREDWGTQDWTSGSVPDRPIGRDEAATLELKDGQLLPDDHHDGFYYALLEKPLAR